MADKYRPLFQFCPECSMLLQANEDPALKQLLYRCRNCTYQRHCNPPTGGLPHLERLYRLREEGGGGGGLLDDDEDYDPTSNVPGEVVDYIQQNCVHRRDISFIAKEDIVVPRGVIYDPSLARNYDYVCDNCDGTEAVFYRLPESIVSDAMALVFVCCKCSHWRREGKEELTFRQGIGAGEN